MFLGRYDFAGDPADLRAAYDVFMGGVPADSVPFHCCVETPGGLSVLDCCPSREVFEAFSTSEDVLGAMRAAGLPTPVVTQVGEVHVARAGDLRVFPEAGSS
jgi:hypothetical protein